MRDNYQPRPERRRPVHATRWLWIGRALAALVLIELAVLGWMLL